MKVGLCASREDLARARALGISTLGRPSPASSDRSPGGGTLLVLLPGAGPQLLDGSLSHTSQLAKPAFDCSGCHATWSPLVCLPFGLPPPGTGRSDFQIISSPDPITSPPTSPSSEAWHGEIKGILYFKYRCLSWGSIMENGKIGKAKYSEKKAQAPPSWRFLPLRRLPAHPPNLSNYSS